jgi:hypothetical protein
MLCPGVRKCLALAIGVVFFAGCGGGTQPAGSSIDKLPEAEKAKVIQSTIQNTMEKNQQAMEQQGMPTPVPGSFQPPESMKKYMNRQGGGGAPGGGSNAPSAPAGGSSAPPNGQ